jgi:hypothetical protein
MSDPFYSDLGEIKHNLSILAVSLQKLLDGTPLRQNGTPISTVEGNFDKDHVQTIVKLVSRLEAQLKDLSDTFAIQTSNAKKLGLSAQELATRKEVVETHHKAFESMRENFVYLIKDDPAVHRTSKERNHTIAGKENQRAAFPAITMESVNPASSPSKRFDYDSDDELDIPVYQKDLAFATAYDDPEMGPLRLTLDSRRHGIFAQTYDWITRSRRNKVIFAGSNLAIIVACVVFVIILF